ncbi:MAG: FAD-dependent monooxygenase [Alphaproteobacteria bacterium]
MTEDRIFVAGAGPVGMVAAARLANAGVPVTVFETLPDLATESRASTFHPPTLDMLDEIGAAAPLIAGGLKAPKLQYRSTRFGVLATFDFGDIADLTSHPYRVQAEQFKLTRIILDRLKGDPNVEVVFGCGVQHATQAHDGVTVTLDGGDTRTGRWLIGADGASSAVRRAAGIEFEGFTWPERFLVVSTPFDFFKVIDDLVDVTYIADPVQWHFLLRIPGLWRVMFPIPADMDDEAALDEAYAQSRLASVVSGTGPFEIAHVTLYRVHQRVAKSFRAGRVFLAGDAAHINNPLGGMGMNGGIHDAVNLTDRLIEVWRDAAPTTLDGYDAQRRGVTMEYVQTATIQNKRNLEAATDADQTRFRDDMRTAAGDRDRTRAYLQRVSMLASLKRAAELG